MTFYIKIQVLAFRNKPTLRHCGIIEAPAGQHVTSQPRSPPDLLHLLGQPTAFDFVSL